MTLSNKTKTHLTYGMFLATLLVLSSSLGSASAQVTIPNNMTSTFSVQEDSISSDISQQALQSGQHSKDVTFLNIEKKVHGFSGAFIDAQGILNVFTTDPSITSIDNATLTGLVEPFHLAKGIIVKHSNHSWHKWLELEKILTPLDNNSTLGINTFGVDDKNQVFQIGFEKLDNSKISLVNQFLTAHNIPSDMVRIFESGKIALTNSGITVNPITAGAEIGVPGAENQDSWGTTPVCTTGFIVKTTAGTTRGLTAGHCQASQNWNNGLQQYKQPYGGRVIGNQISGTMKGPHSDSLLFSTSETAGFGKIYRYGFSQVSITGKAYTQFVGDTVCFSGTGTANTVCGSLQFTGQTVNGHDNTDQASFAVTGGDSGSPVWNPNGGITVYGMVFAHNTSTNVSYYSTVSGIEADQGVLQFK